MDIIRLQIQILVFLGAGWYFGRKKLISREAAGQLNTLVMNLILPCSIFKAFQTRLTPEILQSTGSILILAVALQVLFILVSKWLWKPIRKESERINLEYGSVSNNAGTLGMVIGQAAFGQEGVLYTSIYSIPLRIVMWSYGVALYNRSQAVNLKDLIKKVITHPCMIAIFLGLIMMAAQSAGFELPSLLTSIISAFAACNTVLIMIIIGVILADLPLKNLVSSKIALYTMLRLVLFPLCTLGLLLLFNIHGMPLKICVLETAMPAPVTMAMLSQKYHTNEQFSSQMIFLSTIFSMITLPLWTLILTLFR